MRDIKFRAKSATNCGWVYGCLVPFDSVSGWAIVGENFMLPGCNGIGTEEYTEVLNDTICEFTGIYDKNGEMIFESDIVKAPAHCPEKEMIGVIEYIKGAFSVTWEDKRCGRSFVGHLNNVSVIGNVFDSHYTSGCEHI